MASPRRRPSGGGAWISSTYSTLPPSRRGPNLKPAGETPLDAKSERYLTLDVLRGIAVMGILLINIAGYALPDAAYFSPTAYGEAGPRTSQPGRSISCSSTARCAISSRCCSGRAPSW